MWLTGSNRRQVATSACPHTATVRLVHMTSDQASPSQPTVYDMLDDWVGERFSMHVAEQLSGMPPEQLDAFHAHYEQWQPRLRARHLDTESCGPTYGMDFRRSVSLRAE